MRLPDTTGVALLPRLREHMPGGEVILMTGDASLATAIAAVREGVFAYVQKPFAPEDLLALGVRALAQVQLRRERQRLASELAVSERLYRGVVESVESLIVGIDRDGAIRMWNRCATQITGWEQDELLGHPFIDIVIAEAQREQCHIGMKQAWRDRRLLEHECGVLTREGRHRTVRWSAAAMATEGEGMEMLLLAGDDRLAEAMARSLPIDLHRLVIAQNLLPALWRRGALGGRRFEVLLTRLPLSELHARLDHAADGRRESPTLRDFRAEPWRVAAEQAALAAAERLITPHAALAALFPGRCERLPWVLPEPAAQPAAQPHHRRPLLAFPASTVGRKGAWELREALRLLGREVSLWVAGRPLEGPDFWRGLHVSEGTACPARPDLFVLPAHVEHQPRALLAALARGIPVIASSACGLGDLPGVITVPPGDPSALRAAIASALAGLATADPSTA